MCLDRAKRIEAYLSGVSNDRMIVLDLFAEKRSMWDETNSFYGKPWIWCQVDWIAFVPFVVSCPLSKLLNFGGNHGLYGNMTRVAVEPARAFAESSSFSGTGMSMECIERNVVLFEMLADTVWTDKPLDVSKWLMQYVQARYRFNQTVKAKTRLVSFL
jgi:alpha-N-acetylglucosaminidase